MLKQALSWIVVYSICLPLTVNAADTNKKSNIDSRTQKQLLLAEKQKSLRTKLNASLVCMARNIYFEAGIEDKNGKIAVANVTMNRVKSKYYPDSICDVVYQHRGKSCAFSWTCDGKNDIPSKRNKAYKEAVQIARLALAGNLEDITGRSDHYHATYVNPAWRTSMKRKVKIGQHIFYKMYNS